MAKTEKEQNPFLPDYKLPELEGYEDQSGELIGYWDPEECYIHVIPKEVTLFDNKIDTKKPSILIIGELVDECILLPPTTDDDDSDGPIIGKVGDLVGIWYSPGMRGIINLGGEPTLIAANGLKEIKNKPNDMKLYMVRSKKKGFKLPVTNDYRKDSLMVKTPFDVIQRTGQQPRRPGGEPVDDANIPF